MQKNLFLLILIFCSCSTSHVTVKNNFDPAGKKIAIGIINLSPQRSKGNTDTVCTCTGQTTGKALMPWLQQAGFIVTELPLNNGSGNVETMPNAATAKVDYILTGEGIVDITGKRKDVFMHQLTLQIKDVNTGEIVTSVSYSGAGVRPAGAAKKIGGELVRKITNNK
jgi:hypothetical protein